MMVRLRPVALGVIALAGALVLALWWPNQRPSIDPADVQIQAILVPPGKAENPLPGGEDKWTLEITLGKSTDRPLHVSDRDWFFQVTPFVEGMGIGVWDFKQGLTGGTSGSTIGGTDFWIGHDGRHVPMVVKALASKGVAAGEQQVSSIPAFGYAGERFPVQIRYYLNGPEPAAGGPNAFVVYSHYEKRWGRDVSWTKTVQVVRP